MDTGFTLIGNFRARCDTCGKVLPTGMVSLSGHWNECAGKGMKEGLIKFFEDKKQWYGITKQVK